MKARTALLAALILLVVAGAGLELAAGGMFSTNQSGSAKQTTLEDLIAGKFATAVDKEGTGGVVVTVRDLRVLYVRDESDGDWHVAVTDGRVPVFITEIIPRDQLREGRPHPGTVVDETGVPYCDTAHQTEAWHDSTCWEIHPVTSWELSAGNPEVPTTTYAGSNVNASFSYGQNPIARGSTQTITVTVNDSDGLVAGVVVYLRVTYASQATTKDLQCTTLTTGACSVSWLIGATSDPGVFGVEAGVNDQTFSSSFEVTS